MPLARFNSDGSTDTTFDGDGQVTTGFGGDGKFDRAVFRPTNGTWYLNRLTSGFAGIAFEANTDTPILSVFVQ